MASARKIFSTCSALIIGAATLFPDPAFSMSIAREKELSQEFKEMVFSHYQVIREPLIAGYVEAVGQRVLAALPPQPFSYRFYVIKDDSFNAAAGPGGLIIVHSGLVAAMEGEEELAGILAHEISHGVHRHLAERAGQLVGVGLAALATIAAGVLLGQTGGGMPAEALVLGAVSAGQSRSLAYSREAETEADKTSLNYLQSAGYSADGLMKILRKMRSRQWFGPQEIPTYLTTHPGLEERMAYIGSQSSMVPDRQERSYRINPDDFKWARTKLVAMYGVEDEALREFEREVKEQPENIFSHYGYGLALARVRNFEEAATHLRSALDRAAFNPHLLIDLGRIHFRGGQYEQAVKVLKSAAVVSPDNVEGMYFLGRSYLELERYDEAVALFSKVAEEYEDIREAYYYLGQAYGKQDNFPKAHYNLGIFYKHIRDLRNAMFHLKKASELTEDPEEKRKIETMIKGVTKDRRKQRQSSSFSATRAVALFSSGHTADQCRECRR